MRITYTVANTNSWIYSNIFSQKCEIALEIVSSFDFNLSLLQIETLTHRLLSVSMSSIIMQITVISRHNNFMYIRTLPSFPVNGFSMICIQVKSNITITTRYIIMRIRTPNIRNQYDTFLIIYLRYFLVGSPLYSLSVTFTSVSGVYSKS